MNRNPLKLMLAFLIFFLIGLMLSANLYAYLFPSPYLGQEGFLGLYYPSHFWVWANLPGQNRIIDTIITIFGFVCVFFFLIIITLKNKVNGKLNKTLHGSSRWLTNPELAKSGLLDNPYDIVLGMRNQARYVKSPTGWKMLRNDRLIFGTKDTHTVAIAPTRSGKGISVVIPTALNWRGSMIVYDLKGELWQLTSGHRHRFSHCIKFEPASRDSSHFNPLNFISDNQVADVDNLTAILVVGNDKDSHWTSNARQLIAGVTLYVLNTLPTEKHTLYQVYRTLNNPEHSLAELWLLMMQSPHSSVQEIGRAMQSKPENEFGSILSTANTALKIFADPTIQTNTADSSFSIKELMFGQHPVTLYLIVKPQDGERLAPLTRIFFDFVAKQLFSCINPAKPNYKHKMLLLIDEFTSLGRMEFFENQLAYFAGYGIRCLFIFQGFNQLYKVYGKETSILSNCHNKVLLGAADVNDAKLISDYLGKETVISKSLSKSTNSESASESTTGRNLLTPDEILRLSYDKIILLQMGNYPYLAKKIMYYLDKRFLPFTQLTPPSLTQTEEVAVPALPVEKIEVVPTSLATPPLVAVAIEKEEEVKPTFVEEERLREAELKLKEEDDTLSLSSLTD